MEMYVMYVYMVKWGSDFIPSDADSDHVSAKLELEATPDMGEAQEAQPVHEGLLGQVTLLHSHKCDL